MGWLSTFWDISNKPFPDFSKQLVWSNICLIKSSIKGHKAAFLYNLQWEWFTKVFQYVSILLQKKAHIRQSTGTKTAKLKGVSKDQIRQVESGVDSWLLFKLTAT